MGNEEIKNVVKILGLQYGKKYTEVSELNSLRYGRLMIMADQDQDGSHIKGLVINFIHHNWPHLLRHGFVEEFITPIVKVSYKLHTMYMYSSNKIIRPPTCPEKITTMYFNLYRGPRMNGPYIGGHYRQVTLSK